MAALAASQAEEDSHHCVALDTHCKARAAPVAGLFMLTFLGSCLAAGSDDIPEWKVMQGSEDKEGLIIYGKTLAAKILVLPASSSVDKT